MNRGNHMSITKDTILKIANLAKISITSDETEKLESEISSMIGLKSVLTYEYFLNRYEEISGSNLITEDREFCSLFKKLL